MQPAGDGLAESSWPSPSARSARHAASTSRDVATGGALALVVDELSGPDAGEAAGLPLELAEVVPRGGGGAAGPPVAAANATGSATAARPQRNAAVLTATATPLSSIAHSIAAAETGSAPDW